MPPSPILLKIPTLTPYFHPLFIKYWISPSIVGGPNFGVSLFLQQKGFQKSFLKISDKKSKCILFVSSTKIFLWSDQSLCHTKTRNA